MTITLSVLTSFLSGIIGVVITLMWATHTKRKEAERELQLLIEKLESDFGLEGKQ